MKILFVLLLALGCYANPTGSELKKTPSTVFDFTYQSPSNKIQETLSDMILIEISKQTFLERRQENLWQCQTDQFGTTYCPTGLESAKSYTAYSPSTSLEREDTVIDYEQGIYAEKTSVVRDFMDGFATTRTSSVVDYQSGSGTSNVGTVIDYQNGSSVKRTGFVVDYANKILTTKTCSGDVLQKRTMTSIRGGTNYGSWITIGSEGVQAVLNWSTKTFTKIRINNGKLEENPNNTGWTEVGLGGAEFSGGYTFVSGVLVHTWPADLIRINNGKIEANMYDNEYGGGYNYGFTTFPYDNTEHTYYWFYYSPTANFNNIQGYQLRLSTGTTDCSTSTCPSGYIDNGTNCQKNVSYDFYQYTCPATYAPINNGFTSYAKTDPNTSAENWNSLDDAVNSATAPVGNCQKTITYSYYKYNCPTGYTVRDGGLTSACPRTDPDKAINNESTLSQPCNSATPAAGNCEKVIPYTFYSYECSAGYTAIDKGLATCTKTDNSTSSDTSSTLGQACNSATPPKENCYKDISYKHYTYGCSPGYITDNYGLETCPKTDPNKNVNNSATLDDACNSKTPPEGNCKRSYSYKYYEYLCQGKNSFLESYNTLNKGLASCTKTDTNKNAVNSELANACNSSTPPANNCQSTEYACDSTLFKPVYVGGKWVCSPFFCDGNMKCGYGTCDLPTTPSATKYQDIAYNPLGTVNNNKCNGDICDFVVNARVTYCESKQCPKGDDIIEKNGKCYKLECPAETYLSGEKCIKVN